MSKRNSLLTLNQPDGGHGGKPTEKPQRVSPMLLFFGSFLFQKRNEQDSAILELVNIMEWSRPFPTLLN